MGVGSQELGCRALFREAADHLRVESWDELCRIDRGIGIEMHVESAHASDRCRSDSAGFCNETNDVTRDELAYLLLLLPGEVVESSNASLHPFGNLYGGGGGGDGEGKGLGGEEGWNG